MIDRIRRLLRRFGWGFGDQALSSLENFLLGILVARAVGAEEFGAFSLAFSTYLLVMGVSRSVTSDPLIVRFSGVEEPAYKRATGEANGAAFLIGCVGAVAVVSASFFVRPALGGALLALGFTLPGLLTQDGWRFAFFAADQGSKAFVNDLVWALLLAVMAGAVLFMDQASAFAFVLVWGASATIAAGIGIVQSGVVPRPSRTVPWLRTHKDLAIPFLGQFGALIGGAQLSIYGISAIAGLAAAGALRAAAILLGPITMFYRGIRLTAVPDAVRTAKRSPQALRGLVTKISLTLGIGTLAWGFALLIVPDSISRELLGETWTGARAIILPITLSTACGGVISGLEMGLRALAAAKRSFRARVALAPLVVVGGIAGAFIDGVEGAAWGQFLGMTLGMGIWRWHFVKALTEAIAAKGQTEASALDA